MKVLLVEDHPLVAQTSLMLLKCLNYEVTHAETGLSALEVAGQFVPDVVLIDIGLPDITGYEVAKRLRKIPGLESKFLVALTGYDCEEKALAAGFNCYCTKPLDFSRLPALMNGERGTNGHC